MQLYSCFEHCQIFRMTFSQCDYGYTLYLLKHEVMYRSTWHYIISSVLAQLHCSLLCRQMILLNQVLSSCALHTSTLILYPSLLVQFIYVFTAWLAINWWRCHEAFCILFHVRQRIAIFFFTQLWFIDCEATAYSVSRSPDDCFPSWELKGMKQKVEASVLELYRWRKTQSCSRLTANPVI